MVDGTMVLLMRSPPIVHDRISRKPLVSAGRTCWRHCMGMGAMPASARDDPASGELRVSCRSRHLALPSC